LVLLGEDLFLHQRVDIDPAWHFLWWGHDERRHENIQEFFRQSESGGVFINPGAVTDEKVLNTVRDWAYGQLDDALKRMIVGDVNPVSEDARKVPDGVDHLTREFMQTRVTDFDRWFYEGHNMEWNPQPRGTLPNITSMTGKDGKPFKWTDFARVVDLDDPFFKTINLNIMANADFANLPIFFVASIAMSHRVRNSQDGTPKAGRRAWLRISAAEIGRRREIRKLHRDNDLRAAALHRQLQRCGSVFSRRSAPIRPY
jgi:hypothetical protein